MEWRGRIGPTDEVILSEAAEILDLPPRVIRHLVETGEIPARTNRFLTYISLADLEIYRLRTRVNPAAPEATFGPRQPWNPGPEALTPREGLDAAAV
jgi:hypothetical protein